MLPIGNLLGGLSPSQFLADYWQKRPLLVRGALPGFTSPITPDELAGLALEEDIESRMVLERDGCKPWELRRGPFTDATFATLPATHWTLLVQECNKYIPELADLLERFTFIPRWRLDDVMVSYAPLHGSVGPHVDQYDVFLLQGLGRRRWQIDMRPVDPDNFIPGLDLRILREFAAEQEWVLEPGDMLYLPPGVPHYGVALDDCMTLSVGFRAPSHTDIITGYLEYLADTLSDQTRYQDPDLTVQTHSGEISTLALERIRAILRALPLDHAHLSEWLGRYATEPKSGQAIEPRARKTSEKTLTKRIASGATLERNPYCRAAFVANPDAGATLFVDGNAFALRPELAFAAPLLCDHRRCPATALRDAMSKPGFPSLLTELINNGYYELSHAN